MAPARPAYECKGSREAGRDHARWRHLAYEPGALRCGTWVYDLGGLADGRVRASSCVHELVPHADPCVGLKFIHVDGSFDPALMLALRAHRFIAAHMADRMRVVVFEPELFNGDIRAKA